MWCTVKTGDLKMTRSKKKVAIGTPAGQLVDADTVARITGFSVQYIRRVATAKKIPSYGLKNGSRVYRRYVVEEVLKALKEQA
jgi:hypothetical protein